MNTINSARWITTVLEEGNDSCRMFTRTIKTDKDIQKAVFRVTALGMYEAYINGFRIGGEFRFMPGWTYYDRRVQYQSYDVTEYIKDNEIKIEVFVAKGWFSGRIAGSMPTDKTGFALACTVDVDFTDGTDDFYCSCQKDCWKAAKTAVVFSDIYDGEIYDERIQPYDFKPVTVYAGFNANNIIEQDGEYITEHEHIKPVSLIVTPKGERVLDFGQNMTGYVRFTVTARSGEKVILSHAEVLDSEGNFYTDNLRSAKQRVEFISKGGTSVYAPHFSFQGFRYVRIDEWPGTPDLGAFEAIAVYSDMRMTGRFESSDKLLNKLYQNTIWGQKSNFLDIPTDCPQRDERLGWTGDAQVFCKAASYNFNVYRFFRKWLHDVALSQGMNGAVPETIPCRFLYAHSSSAWGDAAVICPYQMYITYGDREILEDQYESMAKWVEYVKNQGRDPYLWNTGSHYGDWLALDVPFGTYKGKTDIYLIATAYYANSVDIVRKASKILKKNKKTIRYYDDLYENIVRSFQKEYVKDNMLISDTQTAYVLALHFGLLEGKDKENAVNSLVSKIHEFNDKISTGFLGTPYILHVLAENGHSDLAYKLLLEREYPSWIYPVTKGATTIWEHWDGIRPDGTMWSKDMNSFNHYAYGAVADFMYEKVAGINPDESNPGFRHIIFKPVICRNGQLTYAKSGIVTKYGEACSAWEIKGNKVYYTFTVPKKTTASIYIGKTYEVKSGVYSYEEEL
jgi:alpha-L-rhamnosidase